MVEGMVDLVEAASRLRIAYQAAHRLVLTGELKGQRRNGRWYVDAAHLELVAERREQASPPESNL